MKKGGVCEVNSFVLIGPSQWTRDSIHKKPNASTSTNISVPSETKTTTKNAQEPSKTVKSLKKTDDAGESKSRKGPMLVKNNRTGATKKVEDKIMKVGTKLFTVPGTTLNKNFSSSVAAEKCATSSHMIAGVSNTANVIEQMVSSELKKGVDEMVDTMEDDSDYSYNDDFEDYESTFESYSGSESTDSSHQNHDSAENYLENHQITIEEEKKMDSGSYSLMPQKQIQKESNQLDIIREALQKENLLLNYNKRLKEGFSAADQYSPSTPVSDFQTELLLNFNDKSMQNFSNAKMKQQNSKTARIIQTRSEKLMKMITLDIMNYILYEQLTVPYEIFMRTFAHQNTKQVYTQTSEDNSSCEIQTEEITSKNKWTQYPVQIWSSELSKNNLEQLLAGVGDENTDLMEDTQEKQKINTRKMNNFIMTYGEEIIAVLEENLHETEIENMDTSGAMATEISSYVSCVRYNSIPILCGRPVLLVQYDPYDSARLLTVHLKENATKAGYCLLCVWNIYQPWKPKLVLKSYGNVSCACFVSSCSSYVVAGHEDGSLCIWNLRENNSYFVEKNSGDEGISFRTLFPCYHTAEEQKNANHESKVVQVDAVQASKNNSMEYKQETVYSIEEDNKLIIWTLLLHWSPKCDDDSAPWSRIKFFINQIVNIAQLSPKNIFQVTTARVWSEFYILLGTNTGYVMNFNLSSKKLKKYRKFSVPAESNQNHTKVTSLEVCPYNRRHFATAYATGDICLFHTNYTEPVCKICYNNNNSILAPTILQWLWTDQDYILVLDSHMRLRVHGFWSAIHSTSLDKFKAELEKNIEYIVMSPYLPNQHVLHFAVLAQSEIQIYKLVPSNKLEDTNPNIQ